MASGMKKILLSYDQVQDRLLLTFFTHDFNEYRFWITRHMMKVFWEVLCRLRDKLSQTELQERVEDRKAAQQVKPESSLAEADKYGTKMSQRPFGDDPLLLFQVMARVLDNDRIFLRLVGLHDKSIEFTGTAQMVPLLSQLILKTLPNTRWDLTLDGL